MTRRLLVTVCASLVVSAAAPTPARGQETPLRVVVLRSEGAADARMRTAAVRVLSARREVSLVAVAEAERAMQGGGDWPAAAEQLGVDAAVRVEAEREGRRVRVRVVLQDASGQERGALELAPMQRANARRAIRRQLWAALRGPLAELRTDAAATRVAPGGEPDASAEASGTAPEDTTPASAATPATARRRADGLETLVLYVGAGGTSRRLSFTDDIRDALGRYDLGVAAVFDVGGRFYPLRYADVGAAAHLGVEANARRVTVRDTESQSGDRFASEAWAWSAGLRYSFPLGGHRLVAGFGVGRERFRVEPAGPTTPGGQLGSGVPSVTYTHLRLYVGARAHLVGPLYISAHAGWRPIVDAGPIATADWFPRARGHGYEFGGYLAVRLHPLFEVRLRAEHRRYVLALRPQPGDRWIAGGSLDSWVDVRVQAVFTLPERL